MAKKRAPQGTPAVVALQRASVNHTLHPYDHDSGAGGAGRGYGVEAAEALGIAPERIFKTLLAEVDGQLAVAVVPVSSTLDLKAFAAALGSKRAQMADPAAAERATGYVVGGISPLAQRRRLRTVIDDSAQTLASVYVSAGRRGLQVELAPADLVALCDAVVAKISTS
ncbi:Cys-tRNA(Pro) deacylase [Actinopolymorpha alba]|uniref:Cys-tRNA(Pro) deacylase n=1 Tax=Actinopolymorpha alba TaxID=533267 RepID=UPI00037EE53D|nr:Cys-tRNA(Pro) deacylase [Actinopolymorpha alba]